MGAAEPVPEPDTGKAKSPVPTKAPVKRRPKVLINAVALLGADVPDGRIGLGALGQYMKRTDPGFSPKAFGHPAPCTAISSLPLRMALASGSVKAKGGGE